MNPAAGPVGHRPEIQALRAVAVVAVLLFHLWPNRLTGGYVGVDVFFAISGFLITAHILREVDATGRIRLAAFWARRVRRLLPAALLVLALSAIATYLWVPADKWQQYFGEIGASTLYVQNWQLAHNAVDYLASSNQPSAVQHYWTLSVEEQFYAIWPLLIGAVLLFMGRCSVRLRRMGILGVLILLTAVSFAYSIVMTHKNPSAAYFITPTHIWEFGLGAIVAFIWPEPAGRPLLRSAMSWVGLACIAFAAVIYSAATAFPGYAAALPVIGALLVIVAGPIGGRFGTLRFAALPPVKFLGDISYSVYLWHFPLIVIVPFVLGHDTGRTARLVIAGVTILLAWATQVFIEDPIRFSPRFLARRRPLTVFAWGAGAMAIVVAVSGMGWTHITEREEASRQAVAKLLDDPPSCFGAAALADEACRGRSPTTLVPDPAVASQDGPASKRCGWSGQSEDRFDICHFGDTVNPRKRIALIGDSHIQQYYVAMKVIAKKEHWQVDLIGKGRCYWSTRLRHEERPVQKSCEQWNQRLKNYLEETEPYDGIVTTYQSGSKLDLKDGENQNEATVEGLVDAWTPVAKKGTEIIAIVDSPAPSRDVFECVIKHQTKSKSHCSVPRDETFPFDAQPAAVKQVPHAKLVDLTDLICERTACSPVIGGVVAYRRAGHLSDTYVKTLAPYLRERLLAVM